MNSIFVVRASLGPCSDDFGRAICTSSHDGVIFQSDPLLHHLQLCHKVPTSFNWTHVHSCYTVPPRAPDQRASRWRRCTWCLPTWCICTCFLRIIDPITSRCAKFRFKPLPGPSVIRRLEDVCEAENIKIRPEVCLFQFPMLRFLFISEGILFFFAPRSVCPRVSFAVQSLSAGARHFG